VLLILEAMKMQNELKAATSARSRPSTSSPATGCRRGMRSW